MNIDKIIILGKSASGKDYLLNKLCSRKLKKSVSYTSRPMRDGEVDGVTYNYISKDEFKQMIYDNKFIEYHNFNGWYYGNTIDDFENSDVFIKTVYGLNQLKVYRDRCFIVYIDMPREVREERLLGRSDSNDSIKRRMDADDVDFKNFHDYDLYISDPNYDVEYICDSILEIVGK